MTHLLLRTPPGLGRYVRFSDDLTEQRRQWVYLWLGTVLTPVMAVMALVVVLTDQDFGTDSKLWLGATVVLFALSMGLTLLGRTRFTMPLLSVFLVAVSIAGEYQQFHQVGQPPRSFGPIGGLATLIGLVSLAGSTASILTAGGVAMAASVMPFLAWPSLSRDLPLGADLVARVGTLFVLTALAWVGARSSTRVLDELRDNISENQAMAAILTQNLTGLEATVEERTRILAERTASLEAINADLDRAVAQQSLLADQLRRQSQHDELTGLVNRRGFMQALDDHPDGGWLVMADLDHFKAINDTWGHPVGDEALVHFAGVLAHLTPPGALAARVGGEEFALLVPAGAADSICLLLDRLLTEVRSLSVPGMRGQRLTVSLGAADVPAGPADGQLPRERREACLEALRRADRALYQAKAAGRDGSVVLTAGQE